MIQTAYSMFKNSKYECPGIIARDRGDGKYYKTGYGYDHCSIYNANLGHGDGYYRYQNPLTFENYDLNLIFNV